MWLVNFYRKLALDWQRTGKSTEPRTRRTVKHLIPTTSPFSVYSYAVASSTSLGCDAVFCGPMATKISCRCCLSCLCSLTAHSVTTAVFRRDCIVTAFEESVALSKSHPRIIIFKMDEVETCLRCRDYRLLRVANNCACRVGWSWPRNKYPRIVVPASDGMRSN